MPLTLEPNITDPDGFYDELLAAHQGLSDADSQALNARLILILANHIGDRATLQAALKVAKGGAVEAVEGEEQYSACSSEGLK